MRHDPVRRATVQDVAREAGVSASTVSRALTGSGYAAADVRRRVEAVAERIGYVPDANARSLRRRSSRAVGVLVADLRNPFYANLAAGIEERLRADGMHMVLTSDNGQVDAELEAARHLVAMRVAGAIVTPVSAKAVNLLRQHEVPVVQVDRRIGRGGDAVVSANEVAARDLTDHLLAAGHRRIAVLIDETRWSTGAGRLAGYRAAHAGREVPVDESLIVLSSLEVAAARKVAAKLFDEHPDVTAVFAANNLLAQSVFQELSHRGLRLPRDLSLVAYDDEPWMAMVQPGVTTVSQHTAEMGLRSAELLLNRLAEGPGRSRLLKVEPSLIIRGSSGPVPKRGS